MKLTTAKWYTSSGRLIENPDRWDSDLAEAGEDEEEMADRPEYRTASGRIVYGGGGITPDIVIESGRRSDVVVDLERREEFFEFAIEYTVANEIDAPDFEVDDAMWEAFKSFLARDEFDYDPDALEEHRDEVELAMRRDLSRKLWGRERAYIVATEGDGQLAETIEIAESVEDLGGLFDLAESYAAAGS